MTSTMDADESTKQRREWDAKSLGGYRALDTFMKERFTPTDKSAQAFDAAVSFDKSQHNLFLFGPTGTGKSHLAAIAARKYLPRVVTVTQMVLAREVRIAEKARHEQEAIDRYVYTPVLVIDDLGVGKDTEFSLSLLYEIINGRYMNMRGGLIVTSNLGLGQIAEKIGDDRISSRLAQMCRVFSLTGEADRRVKGGA